MVVGTRVIRMIAATISPQVNALGFLYMKHRKLALKHAKPRKTLEMVMIRAVLDTPLTVSHHHKRREDDCTPVARCVEVFVSRLSHDERVWVGGASAHLLIMHILRSQEVEDR